MKSLAQKTAVVTGAGSGIGRAMALKFAAEGMNIVLADVDLAALQTVQTEIATIGARAISVPTDVSKRRDIENLRDRALEAFSGVHLVCNNAGVDSGGPFADIPESTWEWVLGVDLWGVIHGCQVFLPILLEQGEGYIVNTSSVAALTGMPLSAAPYVAAKSAVLGLSMNLRAEMEATNPQIGISVLIPGPVRTNMSTSERNRPADVAAPAASTMREEVQSFVGQYLEKEGMDPLDVADMVVSAVKENRFYVMTHLQDALATVTGNSSRMSSDSVAYSEA